MITSEDQIAEVLKMKTENHLGPTIEEMYRLFHAANEYFFNKEVPVAQLTIQTHGARRNVLGWCTTYEAWVGQDVKRYEINLSAEFLNRPIADLACTILHEMVHLYNLSRGIKDVCGGQYHNKKFKVEAERIGLVVTSDRSLGHAFTTIGEETAAWVAALGLDESVFAMTRFIPERVSKPRKPRKPVEPVEILPAGDTWTCGCTTVHCAGELAATCTKCGNPFAKEVE